MSWVYLFVAGVLEAAWAIGLKHTNGFTRLWPSVWVASAICGSLFLLALAMRELPVATSYAIWVGIGILGTALSGPVLFQQPWKPVQLVFVALLLVAILGLKITSHGP